MKFTYLLFCLFLFSNSLIASNHDCNEDKSLAQNIQAKLPSAPQPFKYRYLLTAEELASLSSREIGERIVQNMHQHCDVVRQNNMTSKPLGDDAEVIMMVPISALDSISAFGFQNQHTTNNSGGTVAPSFRHARETDMAALSIPLGLKGKEVLPKYAVIDRPRKKNDYVTPQSLEMYGNVAISFKKNIHKRVSWTPDDSLGYKGLKGVGVASSLQFKDDEETVCRRYCEAQIWGDLNLDDVDYIMLKPGLEVPQSILQRGIPVYRMDSEYDVTRTVGFKKGELLAPDKRATAKPAVIDLSKFPSDDIVMGKILAAKKLKEKKPDEMLSDYKKVKNELDKLEVTALKAKELGVSMPYEDRMAQKYYDDVGADILGQLILSKDPKNKQILLNVLKNSSSGSMALTALSGLIREGHDPEVRKVVKNHLKKFINDTQLYVYDLIDPEILLIMTMSSEAEGFKDDKELQQLIKERASSNEVWQLWYNRIFGKEPLCLVK